MPAPPTLDPRSYETLVTELERGLAEETGNLPEAWRWRAPAAGAPLDVGATLVRIFGRVASQLLARLNQAPEQHHRAFLSLLGSERLPPTAARVPLQFRLAPGSSDEPIVPVATPVGAPAAGVLPEATFHTEEPLATTRATLVAAFTSRADADHDEELTAVATGREAGPVPAFGSPSTLRGGEFLLSCDGLLGRGDLRRVRFTMPFASPEEARDFAGMDWRYWDGADWRALEGIAVTEVNPGAEVECRLGALPILPLRFAGGIGRRWLRLRAHADRAAGGRGLPPTHGESTVAALAESILQFTVLAGGRALSGEREILPFGERPRLHDAFYLCGGDLARPGAKVVLEAAISDALFVDDRSTLAGPGARICWETWHAEVGRWQPLAAEDAQDETANFTFPQGPRGRIAIRLPLESGRTTVDGVAGAWLRGRIAGGSYEAADGRLGRPQVEVAPPAGGGSESWGYIVVATSAGGGVQVSELKQVKGPASLDLKRPMQITWAPVAGAVVYSVYRPLAPIGGGYLGTTTALAFLDTGQPAASPPLLGGAPSRPALKSLTATAQVTLAEDGEWIVLSPIADGDGAPTLYLGFDRPFANRLSSLFFEVDSATADEAGDGGAVVGGAGGAITWEYSTATGAYAPLVVDDETRQFSRSGLLRFVGPPDFAPARRFGRSCHWLRARCSGALVPKRRLRRILTNTVWAIHASTVSGELLGSSDGSENQRFSTAQRPILLGERLEVREREAPTSAEIAQIEAALGRGVVTREAATRSAPESIWVRWQPVPDFRGSGPFDRHYVIDRIGGEVRFGDGRAGRLPPAGAANIRLAHYCSGGGAAGERPAGTVTQLKRSVVHVASVANPLPATGGSDAEAIERWKGRSATSLRHGGRAVTAQDFEDLAVAASPSVAWARALGRSGRVEVLIVPWSAAMPPCPGLDLVETVRRSLLSRCPPEVEVEVKGPRWSKVDLAVTLHPAVAGEGEAVRTQAAATLAAFLHPLTGNADGRGWGFGRAPHESDLYRALAAVPGLDRVEALQIQIEPSLDRRRGLIHPASIRVELAP